MSGSGTEAKKVIYAKAIGTAEIYRVCIIPDWQVEQIAEAVVRKLKEKEGVSTFKPLCGRGRE